jgi:metal-responsive CopG/Arc/MetJ family transcriptional regulator
MRTIRLADEFLDKIDHWASQQEDQLGRSEAIRRLVELGLKARRDRK